MEGAKCKNFSCTLTFSSQMHLGNINLGIFRGKGIRAKRGFLKRVHENIRRKEEQNGTFASGLQHLQGS